MGKCEKLGSDATAGGTTTTTSTCTTTYGSTYHGAIIQSLQNATQMNSLYLLKISFGLCWLPILFAIFLFLAILIPYYIAVTLGHVKPIFPSISDDGATPPESCLFSQFLNLAAFFGFATILTRYKLVNDYYQDVSENVLQWNKAAFFLGTLADIGMSIVANFQITNIPVVHLTGATMCFFLGTVSEFIQSWISFQLTPQYCSLTTSRLRLSLSLITTFFMLSFALLDLLSELTEWIPEHLRNEFGAVSSMCEWATAFSGMFFFLMYVHEFRKIEVEIRRSQRTLHIKYDSLA